MSSLIDANKYIYICAYVYSHEVTVADLMKSTLNCVRNNEKERVDFMREN